MDFLHLYILQQSIIIQMSFQYLVYILLALVICIIYIKRHKIIAKFSMKHHNAFTITISPSHCNYSVAKERPQQLVQEYQIKNSLHQGQKSILDRQQIKKQGKEYIKKQKSIERKQEKVLKKRQQRQVKLANQKIILKGQQKMENRTKENIRQNPVMQKEQFLDENHEEINEEAKVAPKKNKKKRKKGKNKAQNKQMSPSKQEMKKEEEAERLKQLAEKEAHRRFIADELEMITNYFMNQFQEIRAYDGNYGHYKIDLGTTKGLVVEWNYNNDYPEKAIELKIDRQNLYPIEEQKLNNILTTEYYRFQRQKPYMFVFNCLTAIYQDLMLPVNTGREPEQTKDAPEVDKKKEKEQLQKKQIYNKIAEEMFFLHDLIEQPDPSKLNLHTDNEKIKQIYKRRYLQQFQEIDLIGQGGFGRVYKVRHKLDSNIYAVKKIIINYSSSEDKKMLKQVSLLSKMNHPNIIRYYQSWLEDTQNLQQLFDDMSIVEQSEMNEFKQMYKGWQHEKDDITFQPDLQSAGSDGSESILFTENQDYGNDIIFKEVSMNSEIRFNRHETPKNEVEFPFKILYIVMEYVEGITLKQFITLRFHQEKQKVKIVRGILQGLAYMHSKKIIHRDLKPANIFLTDNHKVKIGDFGLATTKNYDEKLNFDNSAYDDFSEKTKGVGTAFYRAPEQLKSTKYNQKVDIYSLGIIMLELWYQFKTAMERKDVLSQVTKTHQIPKHFNKWGKINQFQESIRLSIQQKPKNRPEAYQLLQTYRNKYFVELVSCIANPKHFQFYQLLKHLFSINNESLHLMKRDLYRQYDLEDIIRIYEVHRGTLFIPISLFPINDYKILNGYKIPQDRTEKLLLLSQRGVLLQLPSNTFQAWLRYIKETFRRRKPTFIEGQSYEQIRRYTFEKIADYQGGHRKDEYAFKQRFATGFDITYSMQQFENSFYLCQMLVITKSLLGSVSINNVSINLCHSKIYNLIASANKISIDKLFSCLLSTTEDKFSSWSINKRLEHFNKFHINQHTARKISAIMDIVYDDPLLFLHSIQTSIQSNIETMQEYSQIQEQINSLMHYARSLGILESIKWKLQVPPNCCMGMFWQAGPVKGFTAIQEYAPDQQLCNLHLQMIVNQGNHRPDVSIWSNGEPLEEQMIDLVSKCWQYGVSAKYSTKSVRDRDFTCRNNIILRKKNEKVYMTIKKNDLKKSGHEWMKQERESSAMFCKDQFNYDVIKNMGSNHEVTALKRSITPQSR